MHIHNAHDFPKDFKASEIFKNIENKLKNNEEINDEDIASLQVIVYTDFDETKLEILNKARKLIEDIAKASGMDINEKMAITYLLDVLSTNMLNEDELNKYMEENKMILNPVERYFTNKGREEGNENGKLDVAENMLKKGFPIEEIIELTGLPKEEILKIK